MGLGRKEKGGRGGGRKQGRKEGRENVAENTRFLDLSWKETQGSFHKSLALSVLSACCVLSHFERKVKVKVKSLSRVQLFATPWTVTHQAPPSMGFSRQEYWSGLPHPPPGDLPKPGIKPVSLTSPALAGSFFMTQVT